MDGSWYLFRSLQDGAPFVPHQRYGTYAVLWIVVQASKIVHDPSTLGIGYGLLVALFPLGSLALSWYYLRGAEHAPLRIWPALGILLTALPGQLCLISEGALAAQLLWPVLAIIAAGIPGIGASAWLTVLAAELFLIHPTASAVFALAAALGGWRAWTRPGATRTAWIWTGLFAALAIGKLLLTMLLATDYERSQVSWEQLRGQFADSVLGFPILLLALVYAAGFLFLSRTGAGRQGSAWTSPRAIYLFLAAAAVCMGWRWAADPAKWQGALNYRRFVLPATLPLVAMALWQYRRLSGNWQPALFPSAFVLSGISAVFSIVIVTQSLAFTALLEPFTRALSVRSPSRRFVAPDELAFTKNTFLRHWTACPLSILLQGRTPHTLFVLKLGDVQGQMVQVNPWEQISLIDGWFTLRPLQPNDPVPP